jgi:hypothetical protein
MGEWELVQTDDPELEVLQARYVERVPWAEGYQQTHDFSYWRMKKVQTVRFIGGFGQIHWVDGQDVQRDPAGAGLAAAAAPAVVHMNEDHGHNLVEMCTGRYGLTVESAEMVGLVRDGFLVKSHAPEHLLWFPFHKEISADSLRVEVIRVLNDCRSRPAPLPVSGK